MLHIAAGVCLGIVAFYLLVQIISVIAWLLWILVPVVWGSLWYRPPAPPQITEAEQLNIDESIRAILEQQAARKYRYWRRVGRWGWAFVIGVALFSGVAGAFHH